MCLSNVQALNIKKRILEIKKKYYTMRVWCVKWSLQITLSVRTSDYLLSVTTKTTTFSRWVLIAPWCTCYFNCPKVTIGLPTPVPSGSCQAPRSLSNGNNINKLLFTFFTLYSKCSNIYTLYHHYQKKSRVYSSFSIIPPWKHIFVYECFVCLRKKNETKKSYDIYLNRLVNEMVFQLY